MNRNLIINWARVRFFFAIAILFLFAGILMGQEDFIIGKSPAPFYPSGDVGGVGDIPANSPWLQLPALDYVLPPYGKFLKGRKICLDPGHGGDAYLKNYKRGPTGLREAEVNLKIALMLKDWLLQCGATVFMTRDGDYDLSKNQSEALALRAKVANENQCDFFISLHHNAVARPDANFPAAFYHADPNYIYSAMDLGRYIGQSLVDIQRHREPQHNGLYSDFLIYPGDGFGVLRHLSVPGILIEASFHSTIDEEARLKDNEYLKREAYAYLLGIAHYAANGFPTYEIVYPDSGVMKPTETLKIKLVDDVKVNWGSKGAPRIFADTIHLIINDYDVPFQYDKESGILSYTPPSPFQPGGYKILVKFMNVNKNSALPKFTTIIVKP